MLHNAIRETHPSPFFILLLIFKTLLTYFYTCVYTEVRENLAKLVFCFQHVGSMDQAQVTWFGGTHFYPLSHPSGPISYLIFIKPVLFLFMCMYVYVSTCAGIHSSQKGALGGGIGTPGAGITGGCEAPDLGAEFHPVLSMSSTCP